MNAQTVPDYKKLIRDLEILADRHLEDLYEVSLQATADYPSIHAELKEARRRLNLAISRELMDDYQTKLAYRVTVRKLAKTLAKEAREAKAEKS